ncbi:unnamed protein product, partial [Larinioides sclopetarius]
ISLIPGQDDSSVKRKYWKRRNLYAFYLRKILPLNKNLKKNRQIKKQNSFGRKKTVH